MRGPRHVCGPLIAYGLPVRVVKRLERVHPLVALTALISPLLFVIVCAGTTLTGPPWDILPIRPLLTAKPADG